ncbi:hypothetical protein KCTC52924_03650 [Arenibacter antarcticus]|uniref:SusD/RagB family nutrient-binding outer membrane lipoprotein n=1 Tax=Arenibacter antarcticus TaxID=2040469 RepID=A0ABW5VG37_9FLAO|nr:SusD/RagB family nutrient-binding outer membrane lipoprotein [Arenibacter sp. H213]
MKNIFSKLILGLCALMLVVSCTKDFVEINTNTDATSNLPDPGLLLPNIIRTTSHRSWKNSFDRFAVVADQIANQFSSTYGNWTRSDTDRFFWNNYDQIKELDKMINAAENKGFNNYKGIGLVLRAWIFQGITDNFGPIPYSEAGKAAIDINFPKYDSQEAVYSGILAELEMANELLGSTTEIITGDILYNGDISGWKKFANGLRLRILMRQSGRVDPSPEMRKIIGNPTVYPLFTSFLDQAALQYLTEFENEHPSFRGNVSDWASSTRLSVTMEKVLKDLNDPRLAVFAMPTPASAGTATPQYGGVPNGIKDIQQWNGGSVNHSAVGLLWAPKQFAPNLASENAAQSILMSYSELQFILAEARERGFITTGNAETYYQNGIRGQFEYYASRIPENFELPTAAQVIPPETYYTQVNVAYTGSLEDKLNKIYIQKWLSLFLNGGEAWSHWRRTGVPEIVAGPNNEGYVPVRYVYPADEQRLNEQNYNEALVLLGGPDNLITKVWWDVN